MRKVKTIQKVPFLAPQVITKVVPAPTDGWDAITPLAGMDPKRAPILDNWVPRPGWVELRGGYAVYSFVGTNPVESLMVYRSGAGQQFFAAAGTSIYNVTAQGGNTVALTGLQSARWQYTNFTGSLGSVQVMQAVNGVDALIQYDGTTWSNPVITGLPVGVTTSDFIHIYAQKRRLWYIRKNSTTAYFMPVDAIQGPIAGFQDMGALWSKGGYLMAMTSWTIDGGNGPSDYAAFISSEGQVSLFAGTDPTNANDWHLVGTFNLSPPIGRRCAYRIGSDAVLITQQGVLPLSQALPFDPSADRSVAITARIQNAMMTASILAKNNFGWETVSFPNQQLILINVPLTENQQQVQFVMNALTGAWCRFTNWNANCFEVYNSNLYFGDNNGHVIQAYVGSFDLLSPIAADMQCAFNWFDNPGATKHMTMCQPLMVAGGGITPTIAVDVDFNTSTAQAPITTLSSTVLWDTAIWDVDTWPAERQIYANWLSVNAIGHAMAIRLRMNVAPSLTSELGVFDNGVFDFARFDEGVNPNTPVLQVNAFNVIIENGGAI